MGKLLALPYASISLRAPEEEAVKGPLEKAVEKKLESAE